MSTRLLSVLTAILLALCLLSSCGAEDDAPFQAKEIAVNAEKTVQSPAPSSRTLPLGDEEPQTLVYQYDETAISGETWEVFQASDGTTAKFCKQNASVSVTAGLGSTVADAPQKCTTEADFLSCVREWARRLAPDADLSSYRYACTTTYLVKTDDEQDYYGESHVVDSFYRAKGEDEEIEGYLFTYTQMADGFSTENGVTVETDGKGNLLAFRYDCYDTDWAFSITDDELEETVEAFLKAYGKEKAQRSAGFEILERHLAVVNGEVQLSVTVEAFFTPRNSSIEVAYQDSFSLYLSPKNKG